MRTFFRGSAAAIVVERGLSVLDARQEDESANRVGAVGVVEKQRLVGIFNRTRPHGKSRASTVSMPAVTPMSTVMTSTVQSAGANDSPDARLKRWSSCISVISPSRTRAHQSWGCSRSATCSNQLEKTREQADALEAYLSADGPGG